MSNKVTGQNLLEYLRDCCKKSNKLFIPDSPRQEAVADALAEHYDGDLLKMGIDLFVKSRTGPFLIFDFAIESKKMIDKVKQEMESKQKMMLIIQETKNRMESE